MPHSHQHHLTGQHTGSKLSRTFMICIWLNVIYVVIEAGFGFATDSMGLLSDAGHNLSDVASLILALVAYKASLHSPTDKYTYGFRRATVSASVINALILLSLIHI